MPVVLEEHLARVAHSLTARSRFTILLNIVKLATRFGKICGWPLVYRALDLWLLGHPESALTDVENALKDAREIGHAATLMYALTCTILTHIACGNYEAVRTQSDEAIALADEKGGATFWNAHAMIERGCLSAFTGQGRACSSA